MQSHRENGLRYYCNERFLPSHRCKKMLIFLIEELKDATTEASKEPSPDYDETPIEVSLNALIGLEEVQTMRLQGKIKNAKINIVVD